jgi:quercetin dioxygenase-like cupin family protein
MKIWGWRLGMITLNLNSLKLLECWFENDPTTRQSAAFPLYKSTGTKNLSVVYFEIAPGNSLGTHTDSAEEIILVLEGRAEATVDHEKGELNKGEMALIPNMVPHNIRNIGSETLKVIGFFSSPTVVSTFVEPLMPINQKAVGTPPIESDSPLTWNEIFSRIMG